EAISTLVPIFGIIAFIILMVVLFGTHIYHWNSHEAEADPILKGKLGFLNPVFFIVWTTLAIGLWSLLGWRMRRLSSEADAGPMDYEKGQNFIWRNTVNASLFIVWFALTVGSTVPWLWMMSLDAHWYSTMYSWYTFASSFVAGMSLIAIFVIYMKNKGYLELTNEEHLHDLGKFMFAFSIFWCYLWFAQYMLIWYSNQPEETVYFWHRVKGPYKGIFFLNIIINFICPLLILMRRGSKRNYTLMTFMCVLILFGHWMDFYQMVIGSISPDHVTWADYWWFDFGILALFVGILIFFVGRALASKPLIAKYHPFLKESIIHHT
ncbi:MAG TPA: quinol:cytochrome C oxidoreductase, partial [Chitinophagaceae bacterium]